MSENLESNNNTKDTDIALTNAGFNKVIFALKHMVNLISKF